MLCQLSNLVNTREDAVALLASLQSQLSSTGLVFPADPTAVIDALVKGQCEQAAGLLAAANGSKIIDNQTFNEQINGQYQKVIEKLASQPPLTLVATATAASCGPTSGSINLKASGGTPPYQFSIDGMNFQQGVVFGELAAGSYTLTVRDAGRKTATAKATVSQPDNELIETPTVLGELLS